MENKIEYHPYKIHSNYVPNGDQPQAISQLVEGLRENKKVQVLLGATGTGKTFTMANVIQQTAKPTLVLVHNKTLAGQLYAEFKEIFPENRVEYFVSNFDFYRPEAYLPKSDTYIDKEAVMNEEIEMMRSSAINSVLTRRDTIVVASVASIYGLTDPEEYKNLAFDLRAGEKIDIRSAMKKLVNAQYKRNTMDLVPGNFRLKGELLEIALFNTEDLILRVYIDIDDKIEEMMMVKQTTGEVIETLEYAQIFPADEHASGMERIRKAITRIKPELQERLKHFHEEGKFLEEERLDMRTRNDMESLQEFGICRGIENYSRPIEGRNEGERPFCLLDYFPKDFLVITDESHATLPQIRGMYLGDRARKKILVDYGFRLPSALDNRPLRFEEFIECVPNLICTSATPGDWELEQCDNHPVEQIIRPTGLVDPIIEIHSNTANPVYDLLDLIKKQIEKNERTIVVTLTINDAENLSEFLKQKGIKVTYIQHEIKTLERTEILYKLRKGDYQVVVGINLLKEGLDIPEVSLMAILDADKEGFLRSYRSLIQLIGRVARNVKGKVVMYAFSQTKSMTLAIEETNRRRNIQLEYNKKNGITPTTIIKPLVAPIRFVNKKKEFDLSSGGKMTRSEKMELAKQIEKEMRKASKELDFERATELRDALFEVKATL